MSNHWKQYGVPHKGWTLENVIDVREYGQSEEDTCYESCMMCGNERIRYVHIVTHDEVAEEYRVGCICAEKMTNDYVNPIRIENELRNRANRRKNWQNREWKISKNGNRYINFEEHLLLIYKDKSSGKYKVKIGDRFGAKTFDTLSQAKNAVFDGITYLKEKDQWLK
ncbi:MAG TPA: hypothetical protein VGK10_02345 [Prolixibacteraceae bacterium]